MKKDLLLDQDYIELNSLYSICANINKIYRQMALLEANNETNSDDYKNLINLLNKFLNLEDKIYNSLKQNKEKCKAYITFIDSNKLPSTGCEHALLWDESKFPEYRRIYYSLKSIMEDDKEIIKNDDNDLDLLLFKLETTFEENYYNAFIIFLNQKIKSIKDVKLKKNLILKKYYIIYMFRNIEKVLINSNFDISNKMYSTSKILESLSNMPEEVYLYAKDDFYTKNLNDLINLYLAVSDHDEISITIESLIKSKIAFLSKKTLEEQINIIINNIPIILNGEEDLDIISNAKELEDIILNYGEYQNIINTIEFRKK